MTQNNLLLIGGAAVGIYLLKSKNDAAKKTASNKVGSAVQGVYGAITGTKPKTGSASGDDIANYAKAITTGVGAFLGVTNSLGAIYDKWGVSSDGSIDVGDSGSSHPTAYSKSGTPSAYSAIKDDSAPASVSSDYQSGGDQNFDFFQGSGADGYDLNTGYDSGGFDPETALS